MIEIYSFKIDGEIDSRVFAYLMKQLDENKQAAIKRYLRREDSQRALVSEALARLVIMDSLKISNSEIRFGKNEFGKPFLLEHPGFHFNVSHSGEWVVCAVDDEDIGIDVEEICCIDIKIADRFFSRQEVADINSRQEAERLPYFYDIWTLKESYIKAWGKGLSVPLDSFSLSRGGNGEILLTTCNSFNKCFFRQYDIDSGYKMSVCALKNQFPDNVKQKRLGDLLRIG